MMNLRALLALERLDLAFAVDSGRAGGDPFKFNGTLQGLVNGRRIDLATKLAASSLAEGDRAGASLTCRMCFERLEVLERAGFRYLDGLLPDSIADLALGNGPFIADPVRLQIMESYGYEGGIAGVFTDARTEALAKQAAIAGLLVRGNPNWNYPADLLSAIAISLSTLEAYQPLATGGSRQVATQVANAAMEAAEDAMARVRGYYISASDDGDRTPELARIGLQPRRLPGEASSGTTPDAPGTAVLDLVAKTLTIPALPANSSSIRAYRQPNGGARELCGVSLTPTVSLVMASPLDPGITYEVGVVGVLADHEGPESNRVTVVG